MPSPRAAGKSSRQMVRRREAPFHVPVERLTLGSSLHAYEKESGCDKLKADGNIVAHRQLLTKLQVGEVQPGSEDGLLRRFRTIAFGENKYPGEELGRGRAARGHDRKTHSEGFQ